MLLQDRTLLVSVCSIISGVFIAVDILSIVVLHRCIRLSSQLKVVTQNLLAGDGIIHLGLLVYANVVALDSESSGGSIVMYTVTVISGGLYLLYCLLMLVATLERLVSVGFPNVYYNVLSTSKVVRVVVGIYVMVTALIVVVSLSIFIPCTSYVEHCKQHFDEILQILRLILFLLSALTSLTVVLVGAWTFKISRDHAVRLQLQYPSSPLPTKTSAYRTVLHTSVFVLLFCVAGALMFVRNNYHSAFWNLDTRSLRFIYYCCTSANSIVCLYYFVFSLRECRLIGYRMFCVCRMSGQDTPGYQRRRIEIYNIPTIRDM